jgi:hypothetical protein
MRRLGRRRTLVVGMSGITSGLQPSSPLRIDVEWCSLIEDDRIFIWCIIRSLLSALLSLHHQCIGARRPAGHRSSDPEVNESCVWLPDDLICRSLCQRRKHDRINLKFHNLDPGYMRSDNIGSQLMKYRWFTALVDVEGTLLQSGLSCCWDRAINAGGAMENYSAIRWHHKMKAECQ